MMTPDTQQQLSRRTAGQRGFTLVELVISFFILLALTASILQLQQVTTKAQVQQDLAMQAQQAARHAIDGVSDELRMSDPVRLNPTAWPGVVDLGDIDQPFLIYETVAWDVATSDRVYSSWMQYQLNGLDPTILERVTYVEGGAFFPAVVTVANTQTIARNIYREDVNNNNILDAGEDLNGDGQLQRGLFFTVRQEDLNDNDLLGALEDTDGDGRLDARIIMTVDTRVVGQGPMGGIGYATVTTVVEVRNADFPGV